MRGHTDLSAFDGLDLFAGYDQHELASLARHADRVVVMPGVVLAHAGRHAHEVLVVVAGEVVVTRDGGEVGRLGPGSVVGAAEELSGDAHDATYVAAVATTVLALPGAAFRWAARTLPGFAGVATRIPS